MLKIMLSFHRQFLVAFRYKYFVLLLYKSEARLINIQIPLHLIGLEKEFGLFERFMKWLRKEKSKFLRKKLK